MRRSSVAYGVDKTLKMTFDEKHKYLSDRKYFVQRTLWPNGKNNVEALINLANINFWKKYDTKITFNTCKHCHSSSLADRNTHHRCELNKDLVLKGCGNFTHRRMLYPHDIVFVLVDDDNDEDCVFLKLCQESRRELFRWEAYSVCFDLDKRSAISFNPTLIQRILVLFMVQVTQQRNTFFQWQLINTCSKIVIMTRFLHLPKYMEICILTIAGFTVSLYQEKTLTRFSKVIYNHYNY